MNFKLFFFIISLLFVVSVSAQKRNYPIIKLNKIGSFDSVAIKITKNIALKVRTDSTIYSLIIKPYKYEFPYLFYTNQHDSTFVDVRKIESLSLNSNSSKLLILAGSTLVGVLGISIFVLSYKDPYPPIVAIGMGLCLLSIKIGVISLESYNTRTKWSFY